jgi:hypothetical protein
MSGLDWFPTFVAAAANPTFGLIPSNVLATQRDDLERGFKQ